MTCGIYAIVSKIDGKRYVGKSINIEKRWAAHLSLLRKLDRKKDCNRHLFNSFKQHGELNFGFEYLEVFDTFDESIMENRELYWMTHFNTISREYGFNIRLDSDSRCMVSLETRAIISEKNTGDKNPNFGNKWTDEQKQRASEITKNLHALGRYSSEETKRKHSEYASKFWSENEDVKVRMSEKVSVAKTKNKIAQYDKQGNLLRVWDTMFSIVKENPDFFRIAIYSCCNGHKKSYRGFIWKKVV